MRRAVAACAAFLLAFGGVVAAPRPAMGVTAGPWHANPTSGHLYQEVYGLTWEAAEAYAVSVGGHLATINDAAEGAWLEATFTDQNLWIGFNDRAVEGSWVWVSGEPVTYTDWCDAQPDDWQAVGGEDNGWMNASYCGGKGWDDADGGPSNGIVERPAFSVTTVTNAWRAKIGSGGANGTATIAAYSTGTGSLALTLARLRPNTYLPVTLSRGTCASIGTMLIRFPAIRTGSAGAATRTSRLTSSQVGLVKAATKGSGRIAVRVGSTATGGVRCGVFTVVPVTIGVVLPTTLKGSGFEQFQADLRATGYSSQILFSHDVATERTEVEALISRGIKVLILWPQDAATSAAAVDKARAAGVKVIAYGRPILGTPSVDYHVNFDNRAVGTAQARYLIDRAGVAKGNNLYLYAGAASDANSFDFLGSAWETLQPRIADGTFAIRNSSAAVALQALPTLTHDQEASVIAQVGTDWNPAIARGLALGNLAVGTRATKGTVFILGPNDDTARAIADAFATDADVTTAYVTGQDARKESVQYIIDGRQGMTVFKDPRALVDAAVAASVAFLTGRSPVATTTVTNGAIEVPSRLLPVVAVTRGDIQRVLIDSGYYQASDFTGTWPGKGP